MRKLYEENMADLAVNFCGVEFKNPTVVASGILGVTGASLKRVVEDGGAGGVTSKSVWTEGHIGHPNPTIICSEHWMLNAVGLPDAGLEKAREELGWYKKNCKAPLIANIVAYKIADFERLAEEVSQLNPDLIEVNISCPNVDDEFGAPFACSAQSAEKVTAAVRKMTRLPIIIKLSPNVANIGLIAKAVVEAGADGICAINTVGPGMVLNLDTAQPILHNRVGGLSGYAIKPISVRCIYDIRKAVDVPIIGTGGVYSGEDALELMMAGATLVGIGTAAYVYGHEIFKKVTDEMNNWLDERNISFVGEIIAKAHKM